MSKETKMYDYLSSMGKESLISLIMQKTFDSSFDLEIKDREIKEMKQKVKDYAVQNKSLWQKIEYWRGKAVQNKDIEKEMQQALTIEKLQMRILELEGYGELDIYKMALKLAVEDKCKIENELLTEQFGAEAKLMTPQKEQWYLERAKEIIDYESNND